jgi:hypothetical protein
MVSSHQKEVMPNLPNGLDLPDVTDRHMRQIAALHQW